MIIMSNYANSCPSPAQPICDICAICESFPPHRAALFFTLHSSFFILHSAQLRAAPFVIHHSSFVILHSPPSPAPPSVISVLSVRAFPRTAQPSVISVISVRNSSLGASALQVFFMQMIIPPHEPSIACGE